MQRKKKKQCELVVVTCATNNEITSLLDTLQSQNIQYQQIAWEEFFVDVNAERSLPHILLVGTNQAYNVSSCIAACQIFPFSLLISHDIGFMNYPNLLSLSHQYLIAPFSNENILTQIEKLDGQQEKDKHSLMLMEGNIIGKSPALKSLLEVVANIARYDAPTLLKGETGTGKELVARSLHYCSARCDEPFVPVNCGSLSDNLLLAELFGYEKGAFTDAKKSHAGYVQQANGGSLFLDEIDSLSAKAQVALLRFLQENEYRPLGSEATRQANVRIICATNQNLDNLVMKGQFREDLYYRLHVLDVAIPPLRSRENDIGILAEHFLHQFSIQYNEPIKYLHPKTLAWMVDFDWPGNIRELENYIYRIAILSDSQLIIAPGIKGDPIQIAANAQPLPQAQPNTLKEAKAAVIKRFEERFLKTMMKQTDGNVSEAARRAGTERRVFGRLLKKYGIERSQFFGAVIE